MAAPSGTSWGSEAGGYGRIGIYTGVSHTATKTSVTIEVWFWSKYSVTDSSNNYYYNSNASSATTNRGSVSIKTTVNSGGGWSTSNQVRIGGPTTYTYDRGTSSKTVSYAAKLTGVDRVGKNMTVSKSVDIPKLDSYTVSYNSNGGWGSPSSQTKWYGSNITLSTSTPTRTGYTFGGWATSSGGGVTYKPGATYSSNSSITLYAVWWEWTYTVTYNANGGSGAPGSQTKRYTQNLTLSSTRPTRANYNFLGWSTSANGGVNYNPGSTYSSNAHVTLYAVWQLAYSAPRISNASAQRCDSAGTSSDTGEYVKMSFNWSTDWSVTKIMVQWRYTNGGWQDYKQISASGTSGTVSNNVLGGNWSIDSSYVVRVYVQDGGGTTYSSEITINTAIFPIDVRKNRGVAIGKVAETDDLFDVFWNSIFRKNLTVYGALIPSGGITWGDVSSSKTLMSLTGSTDGWKKTWVVSSSDNTEIRETLTDDVSTMFTWYGNETKLMQLKPYGSGTTVNGGDLSLWGTIHPTSYRLSNEGGAASPFNRFMGTATDGTWLHMMAVSTGNNIVYGYGSFEHKKGETNVYSNNKLNVITAANGQASLSGKNLTFEAAYNSGTCSLTSKWSDGSSHDMLVRDTNGLELFIGPVNYGGNTGTYVRGKIVRLYAHSGGGVYLGASGSTAITSDRNLKKDIFDLDDKYEMFFSLLRPITYKYNIEDEPSHRDHVGFIAQEVEQAILDSDLTTEQFGGIVIETDVTIDADFETDSDKDTSKHYDKLYSLRYEEFIALNTHMIQKQQQEIDDLKKQVQQLTELVLNLTKGGN